MKRQLENKKSDLQQANLRFLSAVKKTTKSREERSTCHTVAVLLHRSIISRPKIIQIFPKTSRSKACSIDISSPFLVFAIFLNSGVLIAFTLSAALVLHLSNTTKTNRKRNKDEIAEYTEGIDINKYRQRIGILEEGAKTLKVGQGIYTKNRNAYKINLNTDVCGNGNIDVPRLYGQLQLIAHKDGKKSL